jgi:ABC-type antimicrobial peptide transport system permease subunit
MNKGARMAFAVLGILLGLGGVLVGGLFGFVYFVWRAYVPVYLPEGMTPPAERAEEVFVAALVALALGMLGGALTAWQGRRLRASASS